MMKKLLLALSLALLPLAAQAQSCQGVFQAGQLCGAATTGPAKNAFSTGTSGHTIPFLDGNNAWSGDNTVQSPVGSTSIANKAYVDSHSTSLPVTVAQGGTGQTSLTLNAPLLGNGTSTVAFGTRSGNTTSFGTTSGSLTSGNCLKSDASGNIIDAGAPCGGSGTVSSVSVVSANGLAGTVATATTTPAITLSTSVTGVLKGNGTAISAATAGTDYAAAPTGTANTPLFDNGSGGFSNGTRSGNTTTVATATGTLTSGHCVSIDANGNFVDAGGACTTGGGGGTVSSGTINQLGVYAATGTTISGLATANNGTLVTNGSGVPSISSTLPLAVQANITQLGTPITSSQTWNAGQYFKSGSPWIDVKAYGATGNGSTDDTASINNALTAAASVGGEVFFSPGVYCIKTAAGISVTTNGLTLRGSSWDNGVLVSACGTNSKIFTLNADSITLEGMSILGAGYGASSGNNAITLGSSCVRCIIRDVVANWGYHVVQINAEDSTMDHVRIGSAYGPSTVYVQGAAAGAYIMHAEIDQSWPVSTPPGTAASFPARSSSHSYTAGDVVSVSGYYIQASSNCTSGSSTPTLANYGTGIADGTCSWQLVAPTTYYAVNIDTGAINNWMQWSDLTGPYTAAIYISNSLAGAAPDYIDLHAVTIGATTTAGIMADAGTELLVRGATQINGCALNACVGVWLKSGWNNHATIDGVQMHNLGSGGNGVLVQGGGQTIITNNQLFNVGTGISIAAGINDVTVTNNHAGASTWIGTNSTCIYVAPGSSDYLSINSNDCNGATTPYTVASLTGTHNYICLNATTCVGTITNDSADAGNIGEYVEQQVLYTAPVSIPTSNTPADIASIPLTPGDWEVCANFGTKPDTTTTTNQIDVWTSKTSATQPVMPNAGAYALQIQAFSAGQSQVMAVGCRRFTFTTSGTVYLTAKVTFATSTMQGFGGIWARRMR